MSLSVYVYVRDAAGEMEFIERAPYDEVAGFESCRRTLWGSKAAISLGLKLLPSLAAGGELCIEGEDLTQLETEVNIIISHIDLVARKTGHNTDFIRLRTQNVLTAVSEAKQVRGGVYIW